MKYLSTSNHCTDKPKDWLGLVLIIISSVLLGIWAVKGTIALRNILLCVGVTISMVYCFRFSKLNAQKISLRNWAPLIPIGLMFCWVIFHYLFLSRYPAEQLSELKSTWLRCLLASIMGFGVGVALNKNSEKLWWMSIGIALSFSYLYIQYFHNICCFTGLYHPDSLRYIYFGKITGVLMGSIMLGGILGYTSDLMRRHGSVAVSTPTAIIYPIILGIAILYSYIYIFDSMMGVGVGIILIILYIVKIISFRVKNVMISLALVLVMLSMFFLQERHSNGWKNLIEDIKISIDINKNQEWINPYIYGVPKRGDGTEVRHNIYERASWASAGANLAIEYPLGIGVMRSTFGRILEEKYPTSRTILPPQSTHSRLVELTLAFGFPGLILLITPLVYLLCCSAIRGGKNQASIFLVTSAITLVSIFGEILGGHSEEIIFFVTTILIVLNIAGFQNKNSCQK